MKLTPLKLAGAFLIEQEPRRDDRGYFKRTYDQAIFEQHGLSTSWLQENESLSLRRGVIRGLHFQRPPHAETKLVRAGMGSILDVIVDLRASSASYGQWLAFELSAENHRALYVPRGFAHGFCTLSEQALLLYKVDARYAPDAEGGVRFDDPELAIPWPSQEPLVSAKDLSLPTLSALGQPFP